MSSSVPPVYRSESSSSSKMRGGANSANGQEIGVNSKDLNVVGCCLSLCNAIMSKLQDNVFSVSLPVEKMSEFATKSTVR